MDIYIADHKITSGYPKLEIINNGSALYTLTLIVSESLSSTFMAHLTRGSSLEISTVENDITTVWTGTVDECSLTSGFTIAKLVDVVLTAPAINTSISKMLSRYPILPTGVAEAADDTLEEILFKVPTGQSFTITDVGFIPSVAFGQVTDYATLTVYNRGVDGTGTDQIAQLACSSALDVKTKNSFGAITNAEIASNEVITVVKSISGSGEIIPTGMWYIEMEQ